DRCRHGVHGRDAKDHRGDRPAARNESAERRGYAVSGLRAALVVMAVLAMPLARANAAPNACIVEQPNEAAIERCAKALSGCESIEQMLEATPRLPGAAAKAKAEAAEAEANKAPDAAAKKAAAEAVQ